MRIITMKSNRLKILSALIIAAMTTSIAPSSVMASPKWTGSTANHIARGMSAAAFTEAVREMIEDDDLSQYTLGIDIPIDSETMTVNGVEQLIDDEGTTAIIADDRTMLPVRALGEAMGCKVGWIDERRTATISNGDTTVEISTNGLEGTEQGMLTQNGKTLAPARAVAEAIGCQVTWDAKNRVASIRKNFQTKRLFIKLKNGKSADALEAALSSAKQCIVNEEGLIFASFESEIEAEKVFNDINDNYGSVIEYAEPDMVFQMQSSSSGVDSAKLSWGIDYCGFNEFIEKNNLANTTREIVVGVLDTSINVNHNLFKNRLKEQRLVPDDNNGHGTHVAGIVAGATAGVPNKVKLRSYQVCNGSGNILISDNNISTTSIVSTAIDAAVDEGCNILNCSFAISARDMMTDEKQGANETIRRSIDKTKGKALLVAAAGNEGLNIDENSFTEYVLHKDNGIIVTAINSDGEIYEDSEYAKDTYKKNMIAAPGVNIYSSWKNGEYYPLTGTSQATPHISAAAALIMLKDNDTDPVSIKNKILNNYCKTPDGWDTRYGNGILQLGERKIDNTVRYEWSNTKINLAKGQTSEIKITKVQGNTKENVTAQANLRSSNASVATVDNNGIITALGAGTAYISAAALDGTPPVEVVVTDKPAEIQSYEWSVQSAELTEGETLNVRLYAVDANGNKKDITETSDFYSSDTAVAAIDANGTITAVSQGEASIMLRQSGTASVNYSSIRIKIKVIPVKKDAVITGYEWSTASEELNVGESVNVKLYALYSDGTRKDVTLSASLYSSDEAVAMVNSDGSVTAKGAGSAYIMFRQSGTASANYSNARVKIKVNAPQATVSGYEWSSVSEELNVGESVNVKLYELYNDGTRKDITSTASLYSTDENVAKIDSAGKITAVGAGSAYMMMRQSGTASVNVSNARIKVTVSANSDFEYEPYGGGVAITGYTGNDKYVEIPSAIGDQTVVRIGNEAFSGNSKIASVRVPPTVKEIGKSAFYKCKSLKSVSLPNSLNSIESYAFDSCTQLSDINIPGSLTVISSYTFRGCSALKEIKIPSGITEIENSAFVNCRTLTITIPSSVVTIGKNVFSKNDFVVIYGESGSAAEEYAQQNGFKFYEN